jgi:hypothetical protein
MVGGTSIQILMGGRDPAVEESIRQALLPEDQRAQATVSKPDQQQKPERRIRRAGGKRWEADSAARDVMFWVIAGQPVGDGRQ